VESAAIDRALVRRAQSGDLDAFRALLRKYRGLVYHIVHYAAEEEADREDLGQEIFLKVYQSLGSFEFRSGLATWISRIAHNACLNYQRRRRTHHEQRLDEIPSDLLQEGLRASFLGGATSHRQSSPHEQLARRDTAAAVRRAVRSLPQHYRTVVVLHYLEGFNLQEISDATGAPVGTVKSHLYRARTLLKDWLLSRYSPEDVRP
jgi:RNA polymerase sigma-70 factor (ECF subfamily)